MDLLNVIRTGFITLFSLGLCACGGGSSDSGAATVVVPTLPSNLVTASSRIGSEFVRGQCLNSTVNPVGIGMPPSTTIVNTCNEDINYRDLSGGTFGPTRFIAANATVTLDGSLFSLTACLAPKIPGGVADFLEYQCLD